MGEYEALTGWYRQGEKESLGEKLITVTLFHHKSHINWSGIESVPPQCEAGGNPPELWYGSYFYYKRPINSQ
jgi:hypothetical protein